MSTIKGYRYVNLIFHFFSLIYSKKLDTYIAQVHRYLKLDKNLSQRSTKDIRSKNLNHVHNFTPYLAEFTEHWKNDSISHNSLSMLSNQGYPLKESVNVVKDMMKT